jgi:hypothetical protein
MAAAIKALNAKIRSNKYTDYFCSTRTFYPDPGTPVALRAERGRAGTNMHYKLRDALAQDTRADLCEHGPTTNPRL